MTIDVWAWGNLIGGLVVLSFAADWLVDGAAELSKKLGISPFVVGVTVVAYGTSFPELVVSLLAARDGVVDLAVGNVVGSNLVNLGVAWGGTLFVAKVMVTERNVYHRDLPIVGLTTLFFWLCAMDQTIQFMESIALLSIAILYTVLAILGARGERVEPNSQEKTGKLILLLVGGIAGLLFGADAMVNGASQIARTMGISERVIGLTILAIGTSLPEIGASLAAARKGEGALSVGNILGSCLFNQTFVIGSAGLYASLPVHPTILSSDLVYMVGLTGITTGFLYAYRLGNRAHGAILLSVYAVFAGGLLFETLGWG